MEAQALWRNFPGEIASDLSQFHHRRIAEWHDGTLLSLELLELCEFMSERGALKRALRDGDPTEEELAAYQIANELSVLRAVQAPSVKSEDLGSRIFVSPSRLRQLIEWADQEKEALGMQYAIARRNSDDED